MLASGVHDHKVSGKTSQLLSEYNEPRLVSGTQGDVFEEMTDPILTFAEKIDLLVINDYIIASDYKFLQNSFALFLCFWLFLYFRVNLRPRCGIRNLYLQPILRDKGLIPKCPFDIIRDSLRDTLKGQLKGRFKGKLRNEHGFTYQC